MPAGFPLPVAVPAASGVHLSTTQCWRTNCSARAVTDLGLCLSCTGDLRRLPGGRR